MDEVFLDIFQRASQEEEANYDALSSGQALDNPLPGLESGTVVERISLRSSDAQSIPDAEVTAVEWDTILSYPTEQYGWSGVIAGSDELLVPDDGELILSVALAWDTYQGGGTVEVEVTQGFDTNVYTFPSSEILLGSVFTETMQLVVREGDTLKVRLTQSSGEAQDLAAAELHLTLLTRSQAALGVIADPATRLWYTDDGEPFSGGVRRAHGYRVRSLVDFDMYSFRMAMHNNSGSPTVISAEWAVLDASLNELATGSGNITLPGTSLESGTEATAPLMRLDSPATITADESIFWVVCKSMTTFHAMRMGTTSNNPSGAHGWKRATGSGSAADHWKSLTYPSNWSGVTGSDVNTAAWVWAYGEEA